MLGTGRATRTLLVLCVAIGVVREFEESSNGGCKLRYSCDDLPVKGDLLPIFFMHGVNDDACQAMSLFEEMASLKPTYACSIRMFQGSNSVISNIPVQVAAVIKFIEKHAVHFDRYQLVCHSMGALICRAAIQQMNDHRVDTLVLTAGALEGIYGPLGDKKLHFPNVTVEYAHTVVYLAYMQRHFSFANLWHDPLHEEDFRSSSPSIPVLDGYRVEGEKDEDYIQRLGRYKENWQRLKKVYLLASPADEMVIPWQSAHFGFYHEGSSKTIDQFKNRRVNTVLGLEEMLLDGRLKMLTVPGVKHTHWTYDRSIIRKHVLPLLSKYSDRKNTTRERKP
eukprot:GEMP01032340.1.p1 GENE.GEMP01032340.1~~GEMP01032340.1.p1  ORF type:complete len:379 (+),score=65.54 GEMP01032340.1:130-1137(+)